MLGRRMLSSREGRKGGSAHPVRRGDVRSESDKAAARPGRLPGSERSAGGKERGRRDSRDAAMLLKPESNMTCIGRDGMCRGSKYADSMGKARATGNADVA